MSEKFIIDQNGEIEDTMAHITFDSFMEILIVLNGQSRQLKKLSEENEQLKQDRDEMFIRERDTKNELRDIKKENEQLKDFIQKISTNNEIILANGTIYKIDKVIK